MERVIITNPFMGLVAMQVCAESDAADEEILRICNLENPSGTTGGWGIVIRGGEPKDGGPIHCSDHPGRTHFIATC